ncbi:MAG: hypothetical protein RL208_530 [Pseudomonadota bacterium]|jgi:small subunit ribosomal protein S7
MSRGKKRVVKNYNNDSKYGSSLITQFVNRVMQDGKKVVAEKVVYEALEIAEAKLIEKYKTVAEGFQNVVFAVSPTVVTKTCRVGGTNRQIPVQLLNHQRVFLGMKLLIEGAYATKKGVTMGKSLGNEIILALEGKGEAHKKREIIEKNAHANRAFANLS